VASDVPAHDLLVLYEDLGRQVSSTIGVAGAMQAVVTVAARALPSADFASITRRQRQTFETVASTHETATRVDELQYDLLSGPCVDAIQESHVFHVDDLATDPRWPRFGRSAADSFGVHSVLSIRLALDQHNEMAGLNLYAVKRGAFDEPNSTLGTLLAAQASVAVSAAIERERAANLAAALETNREIGVAIGILMHRYKITREQGFDLLRVASQHAHRKLRDIAKDVADTGDLQLPPSPRRTTPKPGPATR
jgi:GAF domain-containing protein